MKEGCARCGLPNSPEPADAVGDDVCFVAVSLGTGNGDWAEVACLERQLANLRSLLRSVTLKLEAAGSILEFLDEPDGLSPQEAHRVRELIAAALESLS